MSERKLVTVRKIKELKPIKGADKIELALIDGWQVVVEKSLYKEGEYVIFCEIDSWIPHDLAPFLSKGKEPKTYNNVKGNKLKTIKLKGCLSQGLILPYSLLHEKTATNDQTLEDWVIETKCLAYNYKIAENKFKLICKSQLDLSELLDIQKWEAPMPASLSGTMKGYFPNFIPKTQQERVQNIWEELKSKHNETQFSAEVKLDGTSFTCYYDKGEFGVCSRNLELREDKGNTYWKAVEKYKLRERLKSLNKNLAIQGELIGEGIQKNPENIKGFELRIFDIYDIDKDRYLLSSERSSILWLLHLKVDDPNEIKSIPKLHRGEVARKARYSKIKLSEFNSIEDILKFAEGESLNSDCREGLVFKSSQLVDGQVLSFKVLSNKYLINQK